MRFTYDNFKNMLPEDQQLIKEYFQFKPGDIIISAYGEILYVKNKAYAREYSRDPKMMPLLTIELLIESIEALTHKKVVKLEAKENYIHVSLQGEKKLICDVLKGYSMDQDIFSGLLHSFLTLLNEQKQMKRA